MREGHIVAVDKPNEHCVRYGRVFSIVKRPSSPKTKLGTGRSRLSRTSGLKKKIRAGCSFEMKKVKRSEDKSWSRSFATKNNERSEDKVWCGSSVILDQATQTYCVRRRLTNGNQQRLVGCAATSIASHNPIGSALADCNAQRSFRMLCFKKGSTRHPVWYAGLNNHKA
jgi:hypothetical protein